MAERALPAWRANLGLRVLSVALAVGTWLYVQGEEVEEEQLSAQIAWTLPDDLATTEPLPTTAFLTVRGTRGAVNRAHDATVRLVVDASALGAGEHTEDLTKVSADGLPAAVERLAIAPAAVRFVLEPVTERSVRVTPITIGEPRPGFVLGDIEVDPGVVQVRGPRSAMSSLREVPTRPLDISGLSQDVVLDAPLDLPRSVEPVDSQLVTARVTLVSETEQREIADVPIFVRGADGWVVDPPRVAVTVEGPSSQVRAVGASRVAAFVVLPEGATAPTYEAALGRLDGARIEVLFPPGTGVSPVATTPATVVARRP